MKQIKKKNYRFAKIDYIEKRDKPVRVYDFTIPTSHSFYSNGFISHNTMLAIQAIAGGQKKYNGKIMVAFLDSEQSTTTVRMSNLGVRYPKIRPFTDMTVESVFKALHTICIYKESKDMLDLPSVVVWDSIANTVTNKEKETDDPNTVTGWKARLLSSLIPKIVPKLGTYNICFIAINQFRDKLQIGNFAPPKDMNFLRAGKNLPGGWAIKFNAMQLLDMKVVKELNIENDGVDGIACNVVCVKNKLFSPNIDIEILGDFVRGFSDFWTSYSFLANNKRIDKAGAYVHLINRPSNNFYRKNAEILYKTDAVFKESFDELLDSTLKTEFIDKNNPEID